MPIKGLSDQHRLPRLGKIRLGIKVESKTKPGVMYPRAVDYFVVPDEVKAVYGDKPRALDIIIPVKDPEVWANQYYRQYSASRGLVCKGDGENCRRMIDTETGDIANRKTTSVSWVEMACPGRECEFYKGKACQEVMNLQFLLPKVAGLGVWQIDTGSINSILNINNDAEMMRAMTGQVEWIPLKLTLEPQDVVNPDDGKKKTVHCLHLRYEGSADRLIAEAERPHRDMLLSKPVDDEAPDDRELSRTTPDKREEMNAKVDDDIQELFPDVGGDKQVVEGELVKPPESVPANLPDLLRELTALIKEKGYTAADIRAHVAVSYNVEKSTELSITQVKEVIQSVKDGSIARMDSSTAPKSPATRPGRS